ncbi:hypothetical protein CRV02_10645 [Arcobacter sp. CECT 8989]|uniref:hypothetical protein n=1 Tax=Arcobacter sp. CECT 8989 TaxID=2044509 RepID=UPI00100BE2BE|nr:hypothetical protein [Arcobacter sp. CECT 8989]RXJ99818.1 hypothetical protein CRV02_10645 [Arcobacter sp. CECT 8989]
MIKEFFAIGEYKNEEIISALKYYFESKNYNLNKALQIKSPLNIIEQHELRMSYSNYFVSLMSGIEVLLEPTYKNNKNFKKELYIAFSFNKENTGENNYNYLRELRNSIIHRGYDISSAINFTDKIPILIAPPIIPNKSGKKEYTSFDHTILEVISKIEEVIGRLIINHIKTFDLYKSTYSKEERKEMFLERIKKVPHMPEEIKILALNTLKDLDFDKIPETQFSELEEILKHNPLRDMH